MNRFILLLFALTFLFNSSEGQIVLKEALSERQTYYKINATLNPETKTVTGDMEAYWVNKSPDLVPDIRLHLYMNAFKSNKTSFFSNRMISEIKNDFGWINLLSFDDRKGNDLLPGLKYISPDDNNPDDQTVVSVMLPAPAKPGDTVFIQVKFETKLPKGSARTGYNDDYFFCCTMVPEIWSI